MRRLHFQLLFFFDVKPRTLFHAGGTAILIQNNIHHSYEWEKVLPAVYSKLESVLESDPPAEDMEQFNQDKVCVLVK